MEVAASGLVIESITNRVKFPSTENITAEIDREDNWNGEASAEGRGSVGCEGASVPLEPTSTVMEQVPASYECLPCVYGRSESSSPPILQSPAGTALSILEASDTDFLFDLKIKLFMKCNRLPSMVVSIIQNGSITFIRSYGYREYYRRQKATTDDIYLAGSISKSITASALMQLYEKGYFNLDDNINEYLPFEIHNPHYPDVNITFRMLLSHQSSLNDFGLRVKHIAYYFHSALSANYSQLLKEMLVPGERLYTDRFFSKYEPGEGALYCELGIVLAAYLIEILSGQSFEEYCHDHIFTPLDMDNTSFCPGKLDNKRIVPPYANIGGVFLRYPLYDFSFLDPPAGLWTNAEDLSHYLIAHMNKGVYEGVRILGNDTVRLMHRVQYPNATDKLLGVFLGGWATMQHGLGWNTLNFSGIDVEGHAGGAPGYSCHMYMFNFTGEDMGVILLANGPFLSRAAVFGRYTMTNYKWLFELIYKKNEEGKI